MKKNNKSEKDSQSSLVVALIQMRSTEKKEDNLKKAVKLFKKAVKKRARFILFPENMLFRGEVKSKRHLEDISEKVPGATTTLFCHLAKEHKVNILLGSLFENIPGAKKVYNTSIFINDHGKIPGTYRKIHLFNALIKGKKVFESKWLEPGARLKQISFSAFNMGLSVCYDLRFSKMFRKYSCAGANVFCVPSVFTKETGKAHWEILLRARAIENLCYVLAPNQIGKDNRGLEAYGNSMIVDPWGKIVARGSLNNEEIVYGVMDKSRIVEARNIFGR